MCEAWSTSNGDWFWCRRPRPGTRRMGREPLELARRPGATNTGKHVEDVSRARESRRLRRAQLAQPGDVLAVSDGQRFVMQVGHDLGLVGAVLRQLAAGAHPAARVDVNPLERERLAG